VSLGAAATIEDLQRARSLAQEDRSELEEGRKDRGRKRYMEH
jgi:hypothetical protein